MSTDATLGYVTDTTYPDTFFRELSPVWLNYVAALNGARPRPLDEPFTYLELGCGLGTSCVVNAAALSSGAFHACDINPDHIAGARRRAGALAVDNVVFHEASFEELLEHDLPAFDFIAAHGVYSWVNDRARRTLRTLVHRQLKPEGLLYLSYNCLPGWAAELPLRRLLLELVATGTGDTARRLEQALASLRRLAASRPHYFDAVPGAAAAVSAYVRGSSNYLAHEFLNESWEPFYSVDVADELHASGLRYLGSATLVDNHHGLLVNEPAAEAIGALDNARQRQLALDFALDRRFRRDVFTRAEAREIGQTAHLGAVVLGHLGSTARLGQSLRVPRGALTFQDDFLRDVRALMDGGALPLAGVVRQLAGASRPATEIARNLVLLVAAGGLTPFAQARNYTDVAPASRLQQARTERALGEAGHGLIRAIPSAVLGNGVALTAIEARAVSALLAGASGVEDVVAHLASTDSDDQRRADGVDHDQEARRAAALRAHDELWPTFARLGLVN